MAARPNDFLNRYKTLCLYASGYSLSQIAKHEQLHLNSIRLRIKIVKKSLGLKSKSDIVKWVWKQNAFVFLDESIESSL